MKFTFTFLLLFTFLCVGTSFAQVTIEASKLQVKDDISYYNNKPFTGEAYVMYDSNKKAITAHFKDGKPDGRLVRYHENGLPSSFEEYNGGVLISRKQMYENGKMGTDEKFKNGKQDGEQFKYHLNGNYAVRAFYKDGKREGIFKEFNENGQLISKKIFKNDKLNGVQEYYDEKGKLTSRRTYKNDMLHGDLEAYDKNGKLSHKRTYEYGMLVERNYNKKPEKNIVSNASELQHHVKTLLWMARDGFKEIREKQIESTDGSEYSGNFYPAKLVHESNYSIGSKNSTTTRYKSIKGDPEKYTYWDHSTVRLEVADIGTSIDVRMKRSTLQEEYENIIDATLFRGWIKKIGEQSKKVVSWRECSASRQGHFVTLSFYDNTKGPILTIGAYDKPCPGPLNLPQLPKKNTGEKSKYGSIQEARIAGDLEEVRGFLDRGIYVNSLHKDGCPLLHHAVQYGQMEIVRLLLDRGAAVNSRSDFGNTPLHILARHLGNVEIAQVLLEEGINIHAGNRKGETAYEIATSEGHKKLAELLLENGAKK